MRKSAIMVLLHKIGEESQTFIMRRASGKINEGEWCFPGGKCDWLEERVEHLGETRGRWETYEEAAARECLEETGYKPYIFTSLTDSEIYYNDGVFIGKVFICLGEFFEHKQDVDFPNNEHSEGVWINPKDIDGYHYRIGPITKGILEIIKNL